MHHQDRIREFIKNKLQNVDNQIKIVFNTGTNQKHYFGSVYRVTVEGINKPYVAKYFIKTIDDDDQRNTRLNLNEKFRREAYMYNIVFREYKKMHRNQFKLNYPVCIYANCQYIILEDLSDRSFKEFDHKLLLNIEHVTMMIKEIAKFHACSYALKYKNPDMFNMIKYELRRPNILNNTRRTFLVNKIWDWTVDSVKNKDIKDKLKSMKEDSIREYDDYEETDNVVVSHGDYNLRNVFFHYNADYKPDDLRMFDFQLCHMTSPIADVIFLIFSSTDSQLRRMHYASLQDIYYDSLKQNLHLLDCDVEQCYPEVTYRADFSKYFTREFVNVLMVLRLMCIAFRDENAVDSTVTIFEYNSERAEDEYRKRVNQVIEDFNRYGYI